jgi:hypothetical protein
MKVKVAHGTIIGVGYNEGGGVPPSLGVVVGLDEIFYYNLIKLSERVFVKVKESGKFVNCSDYWFDFDSRVFTFNCKKSDCPSLVKWNNSASSRILIFAEIPDYKCWETVGYKS